MLGQNKDSPAGLDEQWLEQKIEEGIVRYIEKQQEAQKRFRKKSFDDVRRVSPTRDHIYGNPDLEICRLDLCTHSLQRQGLPLGELDSARGGNRVG